MKIHVVFLVILIFAVAGSAADINGKWLAQVTNPNGAKSERIFTFQVSGDKVSGTMESTSSSQWLEETHFHSSTGAPREREGLFFKSAPQIKLK